MRKPQWHKREEPTSSTASRDRAAARKEAKTERVQQAQRADEERWRKYTKDEGEEGA